MRVALAQINPTIGDFTNNVGKIKKFTSLALERSCDLVVFSELVLSGYPPRDLLERSDFIEANLQGLKQAAAYARGIGLICGYVDKNPSEEGNPLTNAAALFEDGNRVATVFKRLLPTYDVFDESRFFEAGVDCSAFDYKGRRIGLTICEDAWNDKDIFKRRIYHIDPVGLMIRDGADLIINIAASPFHLGKHAFRSRMLRTISRKYGVPVLYVNQVGGNDSVLFDGISAAYDGTGSLRARAGDFEEALVIADLEATDSDPRQVHPISDSDSESLFKALSMGTRDYVTKCGFSKVVVGLSGGIDSALTVCIAVEALGRKNVSAVFMPSRYTCESNFVDTENLSKNLGIPLTTIPIEPIFESFLSCLSPDFNAASPGLTEQNIQARIRGTILMGISNRDGCLVLSTGNKSELAVGYCTLYGDMNGGLAVLSDVSKSMVYDLARFINSRREIIPDRILKKKPSAELKPNQTDQDDLPPYDILDAILKAYIEESRGIDELTRMGFDMHVVLDIVSRVDRNEYKRHQAAPGLKVTSRAFGYGRRYPIAQRYTHSLQKQ